MHTLIEAIELNEYLDCQSIVYLLLLFTIITFVLLYYFRWRDLVLPYVMSKYRTDTGTNKNMDDSLPKLSVIYPISDQADLLRKNLPLILEQDYPQFEVIVIDEAPTTETRDLLEQFQYKHRNLRTTFIPNSATDICKRKLAITLGIRAARAEWMVITNVSSAPVSKQWLRHLACNMREGTDIVLGYANYYNDGTPYSRQAIYERLWTHIRCMRSAKGYGAIGGDEANFCIRKEAFLRQNGYADLLQIPFGESHLLIETIADACNVKVVTHPESFVREDLPIKEIWRNQRVYFREILHHASQRTQFYLWREGLGSMLMYLFLLLTFGYAIFRILMLFNGLGSTLVAYCCDGFVFLELCLFFTIPILLFHKTTKLYGEQNYSGLLVRYQILQPFVHFVLKIKRWKLRKSFV